MKKIFRIVIWLSVLLIPLTLKAQDVRNLKRITDSIVGAYNKALENIPFEFTELVGNPTDFYDDVNNELIGDTVWLENYEKFNFYRTKKSGNLFYVEYYKGKVGELFENEKLTYYFVDNHLQMTQYYFLRHGDALDDYGMSVYIEEKRILFNNGQLPLLICRELEDNSSRNGIEDVAFKQIDVRKIIYDKYVYEILAQKILNKEPIN